MRELVLGTNECWRDRNEFAENDFSTADLVDVAFRGGIDLTKQILPTERDYISVDDTQHAAAIAKEISELNAESAEGRRADSIRKLLEFDHSTGQCTKW